MMEIKQSVTAPLENFDFVVDPLHKTAAMAMQEVISTSRRKLLTRLSGQSLTFVSPLERFSHRKIIVSDESQNLGL